jgi:hypothetical protein
MNFYNIDNFDFAAGLSNHKLLSSASRTRVMIITVNLHAISRINIVSYNVDFTQHSKPELYPDSP